MAPPLRALAPALLLATACTPPDPTRAERVDAAYLQLAAAEDARPEIGSDLEALKEGTLSGVTSLRQAAVRGLGRLENRDLVDDIAPLLEDIAPQVRAEAANALAQAVHRSDGDRVIDALIERAGVETDSLVLAALARSIGRTASTTASRARASAALVRISRTPEGDAPLSTLVGVALGFESLVRGANGRGLDATAAGRLAELGQYSIAGGLGVDATRVRSLSYSALGQARRLDQTLVERMLRDPEPGVRLLAPRFLAGVVPAQRPELLRRLLADRDRAVVIEAVRQIAGEPRTELYCRYLLAAAGPRPEPAIRIPALDALSRPCPQVAEQRDSLRATAAAIEGAAPAAWHVHAHALAALAALAPEQAEALLPVFVRHPNPFARAHAARVAARLGDVGALATLVEDGEPNVRTAAIEGLYESQGHASDERLLAQLSADDPQLLLTAAGLLAGSPLGARAADRLLEAFERISAARRETWRDPRRALLARIGELGDASLTRRLEPYLSDYDALVAADVADLLTQWDGRTRTPTPRPLAPAPLPTPAELGALRDARLVLHMAGGGTIAIELMPTLATTNVFRLARLAERGYLDGLTFHRWAVGFVIQGGSPGANEYQGDGPYTRDEVGLQAHWRGTVGISTRGRDTGDGQIFVNLVDNVRLDHDYTIVGRVVEGMDVVDAVLEGSVIERAEVGRPE